MIRQLLLVTCVAGSLSGCTAGVASSGSSPAGGPISDAAASAADLRDIRVCVVESGELRLVSAKYNTETGDTTVAQRPFARAYPARAPAYAAGERWFIEGEPIVVDGHSYKRYGLPRVLGTDEVERVGEYRRTPIFAEAGGLQPAEMVYLPLRPGCEFQPYALAAQ